MEISDNPYDTGNISKSNTFGKENMLSTTGYFSSNKNELVLSPDEIVSEIMKIFSRLGLILETHRLVIRRPSSGDILWEGSWLREALAMGIGMDK